MTARMWLRSWNSRKVRISRSTHGDSLVSGEQTMISQREFFSASRMRASASLLRPTIGERSTLSHSTSRRMLSHSARSDRATRTSMTSV